MSTEISKDVDARLKPLAQRYQELRMRKTVGGTLSPSVVYLEKTIIHAPVMNADIPSIITTELSVGTQVFVIDKNYILTWTGTAWQLLLGAGGAFDPYDAIVDGIGTKPGCYLTLAAAIAAGKSYIYYSSGSVEDVINIPRNIVVYVASAGYQLSNMQGFNVSANCNIWIYGSALIGGQSPSFSSTGRAILAATQSGNYFFAGAGSYLVEGIYFIQGNFNIGLASPSTKGFINHCSFSTIGNNNNFVNLQARGSSVKNSYFLGTAISSSPDNSLIIGNGSSGETITYYNSTASSGTHITVQAGGRLSGVYGNGPTGGGGFTFKILNQGYLERVSTATDPISPVIVNDGGTIANCTLAKGTGFAPSPASITFINTGGRAFNVDFVNTTVTVDATAVNTTLLACSANAGYSDQGTNTQGFGNNGSIPNSGGGTSIGLSPFEATIDGTGTITGHYVSANTAYAAGKTYDYDKNDITETANLQMTTTDQLYILVGQNFTHNFGAFSIIGSYSASPAVAGGNSLALELADASAIFRYAPNGNLPIANFDPYSSVVIKGNGGTFINNALTDNSYIYCAGTLIVSNLLMLLPNKAAGGFKTDLYSALSGIEFTGGGSACNSAIIAGGGSLTNIIIDGAWQDNAIVIDTAPVVENVIPASTLYEGIFVNVDEPTRFKLRGAANKIGTNPNNPNSFLTVEPASTSVITSSYCDAIAIGSGVTDILLGLGRARTIVFPSDNTSEVTIIGYTFYNAVTVYGKASFSSCNFKGGITVAGGVVSLSNCESATALIVTGGTVRRSGNDTNIGNSLLPTVVISETSQQLASNTQYICTNAALTTLPLPADNASIIGDIIEIAATTPASWIITQAVAQQIFFASNETTVGAAGSLASAGVRYAVKIMKVGANQWQVLNATGNLTVI